VREILGLPERNTNYLSLKAAAKKNNIIPDFNLPSSQFSVNNEKKYQDNFIQDFNVQGRVGFIFKEYQEII
jgi:hypothetical protein